MRAYSPHALVSGMFLLVLILFCRRTGLMLTDTDFWWHLSAGDAIRALGALPPHDVFSFTAGDYPWQNLSWLWDCIYSLLYQRYGVYMTLVVTALVNALAFAALIAFLLKRQAGMILTLVTALLCYLPFCFTLMPRPQQVTFLMTMLFYALTHGAASGGNPKRLILLPLLMVPWANMHGGFIIGFMVIGAYGVQSLLAKDWKTLRLLTFAAIACALAACINPLGADIFAACNRTLSSAMKPVISEWKPLQFTFKYSLLDAYVVFFLLTFNPLNPRITLAEKALSLLWLVAALMHERNLSLFMLLSAPSVALNLKHLTRMFPDGFRAKYEFKDADYDKDFSKPVVRRVMLALSAAAVMLLLGGAGRASMDQNVPDSHPREEAEYIRQHYHGLRFFNDYFQGGFLLRHWGDQKLYIDGRAETAYPSEVVGGFLDYYYNRPGWEKILDKYHANAAVIPMDTPHAIGYFESHHEWKRVFEGRLDRVYIRQP